MIPADGEDNPVAERVFYTSSAGLFIFIFCAILVFIYLIASNHDVAWDLSRTGANTLDKKTRNVLDSLDFDIEAVVFEKTGDNRAREILDVYVTESRHVSYRIIDPDTRPGLASRYGVDRYGQAVLLGRQRQCLIESVTQENLTNAIVKLKRDKKMVIYTVTGHGEREIANEQNSGISQLGSVLALNDFEVFPLLLMRLDAVPRDADLVVAAGPRKSFLEEELAMLRAYLNKGGKIIFALEPGGDAGLSGFLEEYGIGLDNGIIVDMFSSVSGGDHTSPVVSRYADMPALKTFSYATFFPTARAVLIRDDPGIEISWLARTSQNSWSEQDFAALFDGLDISPDALENKGPLNVAVLARKEIDRETRSSVMVFGDADFLTNAYLNVSGNKDLVFACIEMLLGQGNSIIIDSRIAQDRPFILTPVQRMMVFWIPVVVIPSLIMSACIAVLWMRKRA